MNGQDLLEHLQKLTLEQLALPVVVGDWEPNIAPHEVGVLSLESGEYWEIGMSVKSVGNFILLDVG